jgi:hypothetical protein
MTKYVTIIGVDIVQPLAALLEKFLSLPHPIDNQSRHGNERGYSASICLLTSVIVESFVMRARYLNAEEEPAKKRSVHEFLSQKYPDFEWGDELVEVFILRDVIAHNHLWEIESSSDRNIWTDLLRKQIHPLTDKWKDTKYRNYVDIEIARTKTLCLHVIPTQIERSDALKVLKVSKRTLDFLSTKEGPILGVERTLADFGDRMLNLQAILDEAIKAI